MNALDNLDMKTAFTAVNLLWTVLLSIAVWLRKPGEDASLAVKALAAEVRAELEVQAKRLVAVETHMEHMPTSEELQQLEGTVKVIDERTEAQSESIKVMRAQLARIEDFLLRQKG